jgi:uncharacterized membrane protein (DUF441 family)
MKKFLIFTVLLIFFLAFASAAFAQDPPPTGEPPPVPTEEPAPEFPPLPTELPETAGEALGLLIAAIYALGPIATEYGTELIKRLPLIKPADKEKIAGNWAKLIAAVISVVVTWVEVYGVLGAEWLDQNGIWAFLLFVFNVAGADLLHRVMRKTKRSPVTV